MSRKPVYAVAAQGQTLRVVDVTHTDFAIDVNDPDLEDMCRQFVSQSRARQDAPIPPAVREALQRSTIGRGLMAGSGTFLNGMTTYLLKLGPGNLGDWATPIDRDIAASFPAFVTRLRLQDMARLLADGAAGVLAGQPRRCLSLVNIAGGTASDDWNALLYLQAERQGLLDDRRVTIAVLDIDEDGAAFGAAALAALRAENGPLETVDVTLNRVKYDWSDSGPLAEALADVCRSGAACAVSSEGGLFEYGSDAAIDANLQCLRNFTPDDAFVVGSVTRDSEAARAARSGSGAATRPRTLGQFRSLCDRAGWGLQQVIERPFSYNVRLVKA
jgi:hypothetical protein